MLSLCDHLPLNGECINRKGSKPLLYLVTPNLNIFSDLRKPVSPLWIIYCVVCSWFIYSFICLIKINLPVVWSRTIKYKTLPFTEAIIAPVIPKRKAAPITSAWSAVASTLPIK